MRWSIAFLAIAMVANASDAEAFEGKRVLLLHTFAQSAGVWDLPTRSLRRELGLRLPGGIAYFDATIEADRPTPAEHQEQHVTAALRARFDGQTIDLIVPVGAPAARFYVDHRDKLFPGVPMLAFAVERRIGEALPLRPGDGVIGSVISAGVLVDAMLALLPNTRRVVLVFGASRLERFWAAELQQELRMRYGERLALEATNDLSFQQIKQRLAALRPGDAVLYGLLNVDVTGAPLDHHESLGQLRDVASVPIFGFFEREFGHGIVGGPLAPETEMGVAGAEQIVRMLAHPGSEPVMRHLLQTKPTFDARELTRWGIPEGNLPADSIVAFRRPSLWQEHRTAAVSVTGVVLMQATLILALIIQRRRAIRAENDRVAMAGRLITAHEDERRRLARELHDDVSQRLARLAIDAAIMQPDAASQPRSVHGELARLGEDVHALSYRLHPSILDDLGLAEALKAECEQVARREPIRVDVSVHEVPDALPQEVALCLFRVAQEALRNVVRHARATFVRVSLAGESDGVALSVRDDGVGFELAGARRQPSLGLAGMRERVRLVGGYVKVEASPGAGTAIVVWVPTSIAA